MLCSLFACFYYFQLDSELCSFFFLSFFFPYGLVSDSSKEYLCFIFVSYSTKDPGQKPFSFKIGQGSVIKGTCTIMFSVSTMLRTII